MGTGPIDLFRGRGGTAPEARGLHRRVSYGALMRRDKVISAADAARIVLDGDTIATSGFVGTGFPEALAVALEERFLATGSPRDLTLVYAAGQGDGGGPGLNQFAPQGLVGPGLRGP